MDMTLMLTDALGIKNSFHKLQIACKRFCLLTVFLSQCFADIGSTLCSEAVLLKPLAIPVSSFGAVAVKNSIYVFGGQILKGFSLAMIFGVIFGTYSSIYIANTVLVRLNVSQKTILKDDEKI